LNITPPHTHTRAHMHTRVCSLVTSVMINYSNSASSKTTVVDIV